MMTPETIESSDGRLELYPCPALSMVIAPRDRDLGGFMVKRVLPFAQKRKIGPWVFLDHMGPTDMDENAELVVRPHPHIHLATVTYLFEGEIVHRDSIGNVQTIQPGDLNLMIAGRGIVHSEREDPERQKQKRTLHGLQLWMALPESHQDTEPEFIHYKAKDMPIGVVQGVPVRVMMGEAFGLRSPVRTYSKALYVEIRLMIGQSIILPESQERAIYLASGAVIIDGCELTENSMGVLSDDDFIKVVAVKNTFMVLLAGDILPERHLEWNFVSSHKENIEKAKIDWAEGRFPTIPGDDSDFIPLPE